jgi:hypothetical protein
MVRLQPAVTEECFTICSEREGARKNNVLGTTEAVIGRLLLGER